MRKTNTVRGWGGGRLGTARALGLAVGAAVLGAVMPAGEAKGQCPAAPALSGVGSCGRVDLSWSEVAGATGYVVRRGTSPLFSLATVLASVDSVEQGYTDGTGTAGQQYWYWVSATVEPFAGCAGTTAASNFHTELWQGFPSPAPTIANTSTTTCQIVIEWSIASGAAGYEVWRSFSGVIDDAERVAETDLFPRVLTDPEIPFGETATYWVRGVSDCGAGPFSAGLTVTRSYTFPDAPVGFSAQALCLGGIRVLWSPPGNTPVTGYNLQWSRADLGNFFSVDLGGDATEFVPGGLIAGEQYMFFLTASNPCGLSEVVMTAQGAPTPQATGVPAEAPALSAETGSTGGCAVALTWNRVVSAKDYVVYRSASSQFANAQQVAVVADPGGGDSASWVDDDGPLGQTAWYWVRPVNPCAQGPLSNSANGARVVGPPPEPTGVDAATPCNGRVVVTWTLPAGHSGERVEVAWSSAEDVEGGSAVVMLDTGRGAPTIGSLTIDGLVSGSNYGFEVWVGNACGESEPVHVEAMVASPLAPPLGTGSAADLGGVLTASVPEGLNQTYRWFKEGVELHNGGRVSGANTRKLTITQARWTDAGVYAALVTPLGGDGACEAVMSTEAILAVRPSCAGDYDGSRVVDLADLLEFLNDWQVNLGQNCP
ncbi:MAG: fibronectin type III domain-containing protein [Phycisphaeraceae bacterium]|nr:fibronectin type III domain-containing protein [Phycisphaeraceae bacterium]